MDTGDEDKGDITPAYLRSYEDKVAKLKRKIRKLNKRYNNLLNAAKFNSEVARGKIKELKERVTCVTNLAKGLGKEAEKSQNLYREYIEYTAALTVNGKDLGEILRSR